MWKLRELKTFFPFFFTLWWNKLKEEFWKYFSILPPSLLEKTRREKKNLQQGNESCAEYTPLFLLFLFRGMIKFLNLSSQPYATFSSRYKAHPTLTRLRVGCEREQSLRLYNLFAGNSCLIHIDNKYRSRIKMIHEITPFLH